MATAELASNGIINKESKRRKLGLRVVVCWSEKLIPAGSAQANLYCKRIEAEKSWVLSEVQIWTFMKKE